MEEHLAFDALLDRAIAASLFSRRLLEDRFLNLKENACSLKASSMHRDETNLNEHLRLYDRY